MVMVCGCDAEEEERREEEREEAGDLIHIPAGGMKGGPMRTHRGFDGIFPPSFEAVESTIMIR